MPPYASEYLGGLPHARISGRCISASSSHDVTCVMMSLTDSEDPDLIMFPTHRLVRGLKRDRIAKLGRQLSAYFDLGELLPPATTVVMGLCRSSTRGFWGLPTFLSPKPEACSVGATRT